MGGQLLVRETSRSNHSCSCETDVSSVSAMETAVALSSSANSGVVMMEDVMLMKREYENRIRELEEANARLKEKQTEISTAKELYLKIFEDFPALIWRARLDKQCDYFNKTWLEWTGKTMEQEFGNGWAKGVHPDEFDQCLQTYVTAFDKREPFYMEYRLMNKFGEYRYIGDHGQPFYDLDGTFLGYIGSCYDIHNNKLNEQNLVRAKVKAEESDRLKSAFLANMSHEIRTPLNGIIGNIDLALSNDLSESCREENLEGLQVAKNSGALLLTIIQDILDLSKIEAGQMDVNSDETFSLKAVIEQTQSLASTLLAQRKKESVNFIIQVDPTIEDFLHGDEFRLHQVLINLISNAIKFTQAGQIEFRVYLHQGDSKTGQEDKLEFSVQDTGKGIPERSLETIFEPFRQVEIGDTREHGGTGLGLTICRRLVEMMGGSLRVNSVAGGPNSGSLFIFDFPYRPAARDPSPKKPRASFRIPKHQAGKSKKDTLILVAEDDNVSRRLAHRMLTNEGYQVVLATDGEEAVEVYKQHRDDLSLILMDVQMPRLDGLHATKQIRAIESEQNIGNVEDSESALRPLPIIALSAGAMKGDHERGIAFGMSSYLTKPLNRKLLLATIDQYLSEDIDDLLEPLRL